MQLILIKHAMPVIDTSVSPGCWPLSDDGRRAARDLGHQLSDRRITAVVSSEEPKASGTAEAFSTALGLGWSTAPGLHEHERDQMEWRGDEAWHRLLRQFFEEPDDLVFGQETASQALERFLAAVESVVDGLDGSAGALAIVSHGTVISLYAGRQIDVDPYSIWKDLRLPDYVELEIETSN
ncbi:histidine phosphatase family protein [soil metagenome]